MYKLSIARRMLKEALKQGCLHIGQTEDHEIYIFGKGWIMWFDEESMPKEIKGELISLCGDLPDPGYAYKAFESGDHQMEILQTDKIPVMDSRFNSYNASSFYLARHSMLGITLWSPECKEMIVIDSRALGLIVPDENEIVAGPFRSGNYICWQGEGRLFCISSWPRGEIDEETEKYLKALEEGWF